MARHNQQQFEQQQIQQHQVQNKEYDNEQQTLDIYKKALTFNVIAKYDPLISQLMYLSSYCVVYKFDETENDWAKLDYQGPIAIYSRHYQDEYLLQQQQQPQSQQTRPKHSVSEIISNPASAHYSNGLIILNRIQKMLELRLS
ncbi:unnamed protein product [Ambrosiozyma monospora]|uniref:Unnamed protein product n=1 Tax=Ambrosiozyma monospora TaxID=43982 RepID=A0ACB5T9H3_AMBMO|nr:unnamed protein product [Ambrosiozyma monospora]